MNFPQLVGPSYTSSSPAADVERSVNLFPEAIESGNGKNQYVLLGTPGLLLYADVADSPCRGCFSWNGRAFVVAGATLAEITGPSAVLVRGTVNNDSLPVSFAANQSQVCLISAGNGYILDLQSNTFTQITADGFLGANHVVCVDGYFICFKPGTSTFFISGLEDGLAWDALDYANTEGSADFIVSMEADHREIWFFCQNHTEVYANSGNADFPFNRTGAGYIEEGAGAAFATVKLDNSIFWLSSDARGGAMFYRSNGYQPVRVSTHAVEQAIQRYTTVADAIAFSYQEQGHAFYVVSFPTAQTTWVFDVSTGMWHERAYFTNGAYESIRGRFHMFCFGVHLCPDYTSGSVHRMSMDLLKDNQFNIRRMRICPHISNELKRNVYDQLVIDMQTGVGLDGDTNDPQILLSTSKDGGVTYGDEIQISMGLIGQYRHRVVFRRLGHARDMVFKLVITDPVKIALVDAYLNIRGGSS
jgi:hypothetical protein